VLRKCLNNILNFGSGTRTVDFGAGYEHHESTGRIDLEKSTAYCRSQQQRHGVTVIDDRQQRLLNVAWIAEWGYGKTEAPSGAESLPRKRGGTGDYKGAALMSYTEIFLHTKPLIYVQSLKHHKV
jgi:hypothetical protein